MESCQARTDELEVLADSDDTNDFLIGTMERRNRLDIVHDRLQLPRLDSGIYDIGVLETELPDEESRLQRLADPTEDRFSLQQGHVDRDRQQTGNSRAQISTHGRVSIQALQRMLNSRTAEPEQMADRSKLRQLHKENDTAVGTWLRIRRLKHLLPHGGGSSTEMTELLTTLLGQRDALHDLLSYIPYPEVAVKHQPKRFWLQWGELEAYDYQVSILRRILAAEDASGKVKDYCTSWLAACTTEAGSQRDRTVARDPEKWRRLTGMYERAPSGACPPDVDPECWHILHILKHTAWVWSVTPWGLSATMQPGTVYAAHPAVRRLCDNVVSRSAWGEIITLPSGLTWEDRLSAMAAGLSAQAHC
ncbi:hypothetical protein PR003_g18419 [Phytophthora rubi]|uniref:Uncharacterized protein n=1 Tax=Phytophthora rubi TaxID=129364 RepID=A0A6A4E4T8_9STRA|nr:hypothetical protein PR003_g18419 [Phytophthora rubi]